MALMHDTRSEHDGQNSMHDCYLIKADQTRPDPVHVFPFWRLLDRAVSPMAIPKPGHQVRARNIKRAIAEAQKSEKV